MTTRHSVLLVQVNYHYGDNVFIPYSIGSLQAYAETFAEVREHFHFLRPLFLRHAPSEVLSTLERPAIACFSSYLWNWEYNKTLAQAIRASFPDCLIVFGGTQVPNASENFFVEHPYVDILVHHEGESAFVSILQQFISSQDYTSISGLSVQVEGTRTYKTAPAERIRDLSQLPSPYLSGVFDFLLDQPFILNASQETNRGCPYSCTFCDWGGNTYDKIFPMTEERILAEFEWFGRHKVGYLFNCDANYGILPRDYVLTEKMIEIREKHDGCPHKFRMCTAKNSNNKIFAIAKILNDAGMSKGATLSFQSMDPTTLRVVKRSNINIDIFSELMGRYRDAGIPTYTELIMGMPGETYESSKEGIDILLEGQDDAVNLYVYICSVLSNSEMSDPLYVKLHEIKSVRMPILLAHSTPEPESLPEYQSVVVETASMSTEDWQRTYLFYWAIQAFHCLGLLQHIAIVFHRQYGVSYSDFYEELIEYFSKRGCSFLGGHIALVRSIVKKAVESGERLDLVLPEFGEICWPLEEASFLSIIANKKTFYDEIERFLRILSKHWNLSIPSDLITDLVYYQSALVKDPFSRESLFSLNYNLPAYFSSLNSSQEELLPLRTYVRICPDECFNGDLESFARNVVWYGRKGGRFHYTPELQNRY